MREPQKKHFCTVIGAHENDCTEVIGKNDTAISEKKEFYCTFAVDYRN